MNQQTNDNQTAKKGLLRSLFIPLIFSLVMVLTGCVRYDVGVNFSEQHQGEIVQHIRLAEQLTSLSQTEATKWLDSLESRAKELKGTAKKISPEEMIVRIPFSNGKDLTEKFNQFFNPKTTEIASGLKVEDSELVQLKAEMSIKQSNWVFFEQNLLNIQVDLRALGVLSKQGNIIVSPGSLVDLKFALTTPWTVKDLLKNGESLGNGSTLVDKTMIWKLQPGQLNTIEASFWVPSYIGIGTVGIVVLMLLGFYAKYQHFPGIQKAV
ncbi:DUF3153 domain-containing protein [Crocosphaera sp. UHCC 0190]|uniref:DUF3153 domain-containing protein n=1 Tax=Crocosphaera sp. UHCC 0190 TaxID=3110246 RepID=UPI002B2015C3|nr:DUF3153 domain-containing protein [Crocosphaera sp. UHCC 0190]MEA5512348.1 DUF3153 domain-containing protein [Crocosphaera sp. UHCC 0190]